MAKKSPKSAPKKTAAKKAAPAQADVSDDEVPF